MGVEVGVGVELVEVGPAEDIGDVEVGVEVEREGGVDGVEGVKVVLVALMSFQPDRSQRPHRTSSDSSSSCSRYSAICAKIRFGAIKSASVMSRGALCAAARRRCTGMKPSSVSRAKLAVSALPSTMFAALDRLGHLLC